MYLTGSGFVGVGKVVKDAVPAKDYKHKNKSLFEIKTTGRYDRNKNDIKKCQWIAKVKWIRKLQKEEAKKVKGINVNLQGTKASISKNMMLINFINREFKINLLDLVK